MAPTDERFGPAGNKWVVVHASTEERESSFAAERVVNGGVERVVPGTRTLTTKRAK